MADAGSGSVVDPINRPNTPAGVQFASIVDSDLTPSEDETPEEKTLQLEDAQSAIGVSIGHQQTRLTSSKTPAAEKAAALEDVDGGGLFDGWQQGQDGAMDQGVQSRTPPEQKDDRTPRKQEKGLPPSNHDSQVRWPSPWRAGPKSFQRLDDHRTAIRDGIATGNRRRALSGGSTAEALKRYMPFNFPSMPKTSSLLNFSLPSFSVSSLESARGRQVHADGNRKRIMSMYSPSPYDGSKVSAPDTAVSRRQSLSQPGHSATGRSPGLDPEAPEEVPHRRPTQKIRRSNSEGSLLLYRSKSFASSLGDDSRFEHVQEQVNSRLKAIKDSWQDANFKLPSMPTLPNFTFGSREDMFRSRNGNTVPRPFDGENYRVSFMARSNGSSRGTSMKASKAKGSSSDVAGMTPSNAQSHPFFTKAVQDLTGDLVILGGYRGSVLRSAEPPHRQLWAPIKAGLNLRKVDLELGLNVEDEETEEDRIIPAGMLTHIGPVDIAKRLFKRLRASENARKGELRVHNYGYDWRLSPHILSRRLIEYLRTLPCNQPNVPPEKRGAIVLAHSLGGLITRHAINQCPELIAGVTYAGVPQTCVNILGPLRNGDDVLLSSRILTAQVNFTIRTSYALLPLDGKCFINKHTKEEYPVDFFDINTWTNYRLSPCVGTPLPPLTAPTSNLSVSGLLSAMSQALPSLPGRKSSFSKKNSNGSNITHPNNNSSLGTISSGAASQSTGSGTSPVGDTVHHAANAAEKIVEGGAETGGMAPHMSATQDHAHASYAPQSSPSTTVTIPRDKAIEYLTRTLAEVKQFKENLAFRPEHAENNVYPPIALIYGKSTPTVYGAKVDSREGIKRASAYDELAFASGDGVVLARAAMVPEGYSVVRGGVVCSDRGHVTLLGDLEAVGRCLSAVVTARQMGVGLGKDKAKGKSNGD